MLLNEFMHLNCMKKLSITFYLKFMMPRLWIFIFLFLNQTSILSAGEPIYIAYTANLNGNLELCRCQPDEMGSMAQLSGIIDSLRTEYPGLILLDNGDFFKTYPKPVTNMMAVELMSLLNYDAAGVGDQEFVEGISFLKNMWYQYPMTLLSANIKILQPEGLSFKRYHIITRSEYNIGIVSVLPPAAFEFIPRPDLQILPVDEILSTVLDNLLPRCDIIVLLFHGGFKEALEVVQRFPQFQVILAGHSQEKAVKKFPGQIIVQSGYDGEYLGFLELKMEGNKIEFDHKFLPVTDLFNPRPQFLEKLQQYHRILKAKN
jgi:2',3'-cyclic-nucleotide 2'-phosphodiesterase (5'-nucleotidase family)